MPLRQSLCYPILNPPREQLGELFALAASIGFAAVEMWQPPEDVDEIAALAGEHGLAVASMCGHASLNDGLNDPAQHDRIEAELARSIELAARLGVPGLICFSGARREGLSEEEGIRNTAAGLRRVAPLAERRGVNLNIELLNSKIDHPGYQCDHTAWGAAVCERVASPRVKLLYDIYHMQIMEGDVIRTLGDNARWIGHYHLAGVPGRHDPDDSQELCYGAICRAIAETGYDLFVGHEFVPRGDVVESLRRAFEVCRVD